MSYRDEMGTKSVEVEGIWLRVATVARRGLVRTRCGHQNQRLISAAIDGVMKERTTSVSNSRTIPMVLPTCARMSSALARKEIMAPFAR
jgi:hypothetical protein